MQGTIVFSLAFIGTLSESVRPFLYVGNAEFIRLYVEGDNPFENKSLRAFDGKRVEIPDVSTRRTLSDGTWVLSSTSEIVELASGG